MVPLFLSWRAANLVPTRCPTCLLPWPRLPSYWAHCEAHTLGDVPAARKVWEETLKTGLAR